MVNSCLQQIIQILSFDREELKKYGTGTGVPGSRSNALSIQRRNSNVPGKNYGWTKMYSAKIWSNFVQLPVRCGLEKKRVILVPVRSNADHFHFPPAFVQRQKKSSHPFINTEELTVQCGFYRTYARVPYLLWIPIFIYIKIQQHYLPGSYLILCQSILLYL